MTKTADEIQRLKDNWERDACWDIETTEGFEEHYQELLDYRLEMERQWIEQYQKRLQIKAAALGIPGNTKLAQYFLDLETRLDHLEEVVQYQQER